MPFLKVACHAHRAPERWGGGEHCFLMSATLLGEAARQIVPKPRAVRGVGERGLRELRSDSLLP
jgi:hypothetical protein